MQANVRINLLPLSIDSQAINDQFNQENRTISLNSLLLLALVVIGIIIDCVVITIIDIISSHKSRLLYRFKHTFSSFG